MNNLRFVIAAVSLAGASAFAAGGKYGTAGCGLGALVFGDDKGIVQIFAATTNGIYGNQTFAITTGTSNCTDDGVAMQDREQDYFAEANYESLKQEMAQGQGQNLDAFSSLFGCQQSAQFNAAMQRNYESIFAGQADAQTMLQNVREVYKAEMGSTCTEG